MRRSTSLQHTGVLSTLPKSKSNTPAASSGQSANPSAFSSREAETTLAPASCSRVVTSSEINGSSSTTRMQRPASTLDATTPLQKRAQAGHFGDGVPGNISPRKEHNRRLGVPPSATYVSYTQQHPWPKEDTVVVGRSVD